MKKWLSLLLFLILGLSVNVFGQMTDAPDQGEDTFASETNTTETNVAEPVTEEREITHNGGVVYNDGKIDYTSASVQFVINANDEGSGVKAIYYSLDEASQAVYENPVKVDKEGKHSISFRVEDNVGNMSVLKSYAFVMDNTAPDLLLKTEVTKIAKVSNQVYASLSNQFGLYAKDALSGVKSIEYSIDGGDWQTVASNKALVTVQGDKGIRKISYKATDNVGNVSPVTTYEFYLDVEAPQVTIATTPEAYDKDGTKYISDNAQVVITASDAESGVEKLMYAVDGGEYKEYTASFSLTAGSRVVKAKAVDSVGNMSAEITLALEVDGSEPEGDIVPTK